MLVEQVEQNATNLSALLKNAIKRKILKTTPLTYNCGEALLFWTADWLTQTQLLKADQLQLLIEEFAPTVLEFGVRLTKAWDIGDVRPKEDTTTLPTCKLGVLDRRYACIDGRATFLDLETGDIRPAVVMLPLETIAYNLTTLFIRYYARMKQQNSVERRVTNDVGDAACATKVSIHP